MLTVAETIERYGAETLSEAELINVIQGTDIPKEKQEKLKLKACTAICQRILCKQKLQLTSPTNTAEYLSPQMQGLDHEEFWIITLNSKNRIINRHTVSVGSLTGTIVHPREVFKPAILDNAAALIAAHNHPSEDPNPSSEDQDITEMLIKAGDIMKIPVIDHIIIGGNSYYSFQENGKIKKEKTK